jgi:hypothetical protein
MLMWHRIDEERDDKSLMGEMKLFYTVSKI